MPPSVFDLHVHTNRGSPDSSLDPRDLVAEAGRIGLDGVAVTEHNGWARHDFDEFERGAGGLVLVRALEVYTPVGHVLAFGMDGRDVPPTLRGGMDAVQRLRAEADRAGAVLVLAHPFRFLFNPAGLFTQNTLFEDPRNLPASPEEASEHPVFGLVHDIEVINGGGTERENGFARGVAAVLGRPGTGGSDAHSTAGVGKGTTVFQGEVRHERDLVEALREGAYEPLQDFHVRGSRQPT